MSTPVSGTPLGGTFPESTPLSGISGADESKDLSAEIANILRGVDELAVALGTAPVDLEKSGPTLQAPNLSLIGTLSTLGNASAEAAWGLQEADAGDIETLKSLFLMYKTASDPINAQLALESFTKLLGELNTKERSNLGRNLFELLHPLPESETPSTDQAFASSNAAGGRSLSLTAATQSMTGATYFRELIRSLYDQVMQSLILTGGIQPSESIFSAGRDAKDNVDIAGAFSFLIKSAALLSQKSAKSLLDGANNATVQNSQVLDVVKAASVLSTFLQLLRTESLNKAAKNFAAILGIDLGSPSLNNPAAVEAALARFLHQGIATAGLSALYEGLRGIFSKTHPEQARDQILAINKRVTDLGSVLDGGKITKDTLADTLATFNKTINDSGKQAGLSSALKQVLQQSLEEQGIASDTANGLATTLGKSLFAQQTHVTAFDIQNTISTALGKGVDSSKVTNGVLTLAASVVTQQEVQAGLIQAKAATVASQIAPQLSQVLFGMSVDLGGKVTRGDPSIRPVVTLSPSGALSKDQDRDISLGASLLHDQEFATIAVNRGSSIWHTDTTRAAGDKNIGPAPNTGP